MKELLSVLSLLIVFNILSAQKQDYVWTFGGDGSTDPGVQGMQIDFKDSDFNVKVIDLPHRNIRSHASICDREGNLLFYTNGCAVINRDQQVMPHGDSLNQNEWKDLFGWDDCDWGYPGQQNEVIIPDPGNDEGYYLIHKPRIFAGFSAPTSVHLWSSYIDISLDSSLGDLVYRDSVISDRKLMSSYLAVIPHANKSDWWLIQPVVNDSVFLTYKIDETGLVRMPDQNTHQYYNQFRSSASGHARFSPDGSMYAIYNYYDNLDLFDFDRETGILSHRQKIDVVPNSPSDVGGQFGSVEWSPNSRFLYVTNPDSLIQVDLWEEDPHDGIRLIDVYDGTTNPFVNDFYLQSLAPDCRIYISSGNGNRTFHVINNPNGLGQDCDFKQNGIQLPFSHSTANTQLFPRFRVDEVDKCDSTLVSVFGELVYYRRDLKVYPNPAIDQIHIELPQDIGRADMIIYNLQGEILESKELPLSSATILKYISAYPAGTYHIEIYPRDNPDRILYGKQIIKM